MSMIGSETFLSGIRKALGLAPDLPREGGHLFAEQTSPEDRHVLERIERRTPSERKTLLEKLIEAATPIRLQVTPVSSHDAAAEAIAALAEQKQPEWGSEKQIIAWRDPCIDRLNLEGPLDRLKIPLHRTEPLDPSAGLSMDRMVRERERESIEAAYIGITSADFCLADTATLVLRNRSGQPRSAALIPAIHVAVLPLDRILADMKELFALLRWDERFRSEGLSNYMAFISGPSKTADIEATMVHGAHGPREVHLFVILSQP